MIDEVITITVYIGPHLTSSSNIFFFGFPWTVVILEQIVSRFFLKNKIKTDKVITIMAYIYIGPNLA
jgi:hypothetical protein